MITIAYLSLQMLNFQVIIYDRLYNQGFKSKSLVKKVLVEMRGTLQ